MARTDKDTTKAESPADMEARIRREVEDKVRAEMGAAAAHPVKQTRAQAAAELAAFLKSLPEKPRYRLTDKAYIGDVLYEPDSKPWKKDTDSENPEREPLIVAFEGRPGPHMVPVNKAAEMMYQKYPPVGGDPIGDLSIVGDEGTAALKHVTGVSDQAGTVLSH